MSSSDSGDAVTHGAAAPLSRPAVPLPDGVYLSLSGMVTATTGGQTRALLMRNRLLAERCGIAPVIVTFDSRPHYDRTRALLRAQRELADPVRLLNIFEHYRDLDLEGGDGDPVDRLAGLERREDHDDDGRPYRRRHVDPSSHLDVAHDHLRPDGSVFLRLPAGPRGHTPVKQVTLLDRQERPVSSWPGQPEWRRQWLGDLVGPDPGTRAFVIADSRFAVTQILPMTDERFFVLLLMHNAHLGGRRRWNSRLVDGYGPLLDRVPQLDGLVTLTSRQRADIAARRGATTNLYVVPNPVQLPETPTPQPPREPARFAVVARLGPQKDVEEAVRVFALVAAREPAARLDVYGSGPSRAAVAAEVAAHGLQDVVTLHGHDPAARETLWSATGFLMTSQFEGYPLATLEAMARGCPVVSYDICYGPREQITEGVDGFVVEHGDRQAMADRIVTMARDTTLVARMSAAARVKAAQHDDVAFVADWRRVLEGVVAARPRRTTLDEVRLEITRLGRARAVQLPGRLVGALDRLLERFDGPRAGRAARRTVRGTPGSGTWRRPPRLAFVGRLDVRGSSREADLSSAVVTLEAVGSAGALVEVPLRVRRSGTVFALSATVDLADVFRDLGGPVKSLRLRLRLVWENSVWETTLTRPRRMAPNYELSFAGNGELALNRGRVRPLFSRPVR
jgi:poly(glycerol-phosphate) alpha-glucosyltransferase